MNENLISSDLISKDDDKNEMNHNDEIKSSNNSEKKRNKAIINQITEIINKYQANKQKEEMACEELLNYIKDNNINITEIKDYDNSTIIQYYCSNKQEYHLNCMFLCLEKLLEEKDMVPYLLNEDITKMNIFEISSDIGDIKIFRILKKYLKNNQSILNQLINENSDRTNIFHVAADKNKAISLLFYFSFYHKNNSYLNIKNRSSWTPLHIACYRGNYEFVQYLVNLGADINCPDNENKTPLFYAVQSDSIKIVKYLILCGANKKIKDKRNKIAIDFTSDKNIHDILEDKNIFRVAFKCETNYQSLKNHHRNILMVVLLIFMIILHLFIIIKYRISDFIHKCYDQNNFILELLLLIMNIIFEILGIVIYIFFQISGINKKNNINNKNPNNNKFCIKENGIEYYEMFKYNENICVKCQRVKEMNTQHCIACDICIDNFDHHCFFLNCCIYNNNKIYFKIFLVEILITVFLNLLTSLIFFMDFIKYPKIYYGIIYNKSEFDKNGLYDFIIYALDILYFVTALFFILASIIPFLFGLITEKCSKNKNKNAIKNKPNAPLLPINTDANKV